MVGKIEAIRRWRALQRTKGLVRLDVWVPDTPTARSLARLHARELVRRWKQELANKSKK